MDSLPSPDLIESVTKLLERVGVPSALVGALLYLLMRRGRGAGDMKDDWRQLTEQRMQALDTRLARLEAVQEDRWGLMKNFLLPSLRQPYHVVMDSLIDKLRRDGDLSLEEYDLLIYELEQRLTEPPPDATYHLRVILSLTGVKERRALRQHESQQIEGS